MTLTDARAMVRQFARNAGSSDMYSDTEVDRAIQTVGYRFCRVTRCIQSSYLADEGLAEGIYGASFTLASTLGAAFRPEHTLAVLISEGGDLQDSEFRRLEIVSYEELMAMHASVDEATPTHCAWESVSSTAAVLRLWPISDGDYDLTVRFWVPFTTFTAGTASPSGVTLNIIDAHLAEILPYGPPAILQHTEPEHAYASQSWQKYLEFERSMMGAGSLGARQMQLQPRIPR